MYVDILLSTLIKQTLKTGQEYTGQWAPHTWLREHRTVTLGVPRQTGKTTALTNLWRSRPSLMMSMNAPSARHISQQHGVECHTSSLFQQPGVVFQHPLELVLLDEWLHMSHETCDDLYDFLSQLMARNQLSKDVVIVRVGT